MTDDVDTSGSGTSPPADDEPPLDLTELTLPQRIFVAAVQNPARGILLVGLLAFAIGFYIAFWLRFPTVAAFLTAIGAVIVSIIVAIYWVVNRR